MAETNERVVLGYLCSTTFDYEAEDTSYTVYPSLERLKEVRTCCAEGEDSCGIYEIEVRIKKVIKEANF